MKIKSKKITISLLVIAIVVALAAGGTFAYLTRQTERRVNNFTFAPHDGLNAILTEKDWDGIINYEYNQDGTIKNVIFDYIDHDSNPETANVPVYGYLNGEKTTPVTDTDAAAGRGQKALTNSDEPAFKPAYGNDLSKLMIPGQAAPKNPVITNTGTAVDSWVAAKVTFVYGSANATNAGKPLSNGDMQKVLDVLEIDWNVSSDAKAWSRENGSVTDVSQTFYYQSILGKASTGIFGDATTPIFTKIKVKDTATLNDISQVENIGGFAIYIEGFAAQSSIATTYAEFKTWGATNVIFSNTPTDASPANLNEPGIIPAV